MHVMVLGKAQSAMETRDSVAAKPLPFHSSIFFFLTAEENEAGPAGKEACWEKQD